LLRTQWREIPERSVERDVNYPPSIPLAVLPTRIEFLPRLSSRTGARIFVKRDDLTGCLTSGNKIRKLEFVLADVLSKKADTLITCGGVQSNHARATTAVARRYGLESVLFLKGQAADPPVGNLWLDRLLGARVIHITEEQYNQVDSLMEQEASRIRSRGKMPYVVPEGASNWLGALGYVRAAEETRNQLDAAGLTIDRIVFACGSGGTHAGLLAGRKLFGLQARLTAINVCQNAEHFITKISSISDEINRRLGLNLSFSEEEIEVVDGYVGEGYAKDDAEIAQLITEVARTEGLVLDPVYTGKAMYGLLDLLSKGDISRKESILFLHTGGIFSLFAYTSSIPSPGSSVQET
jgi:D-cysteine desulfhydrase